MAVKAKRLEYDAALDRAGRIAAEKAPPITLEEPWTPEHLMLAALLRCSVASLAYHARRAGRDVLAAGSAHGLVTMREEDGRYAFVELDVTLEAELDPPLSADELAALLAKAERDCFVSASLRVKPRYSWRVNGEEAAVA